MATTVEARGDTAAHAERHAERGSEGQNINSAERWMSMIGGSLIALYGLRRRDVPGTAAALLGAALVHRGMTGHCVVYDALGVDTSREGPGFLEQKHGPAAVLDASKA